jgi:hypothetical protein
MATIPVVPPVKFDLIIDPEAAEATRCRRAHGVICRT